MPFPKMQAQISKLQQKQASDSSQQSLCQSDELVIVREHMNFIIGLLLAPDFKQIVNWSSLRSTDLALDESAMEDVPCIRNFIILTALKIQQLMGEIKES